MEFQKNNLMRTGEFKPVKNISEYIFVSQLISRLTSHGCKRRNYKLISSLLAKFRLSINNMPPYSEIINTIDPLILRLLMLQVTQRGKKLEIPLPVTRKLAISTFISDLIKLMRKGEVKHKEIASFLFTILKEAQDKKGILYLNKKEAYKVAKQNAYATRRIYITKNNRK